MRRAYGVHSMWELWCASFRRSADRRARVVLDGAACRQVSLGDVRDVLAVYEDRPLEKKQSSW